MCLVSLVRGKKLGSNFQKFLFGQTISNVGSSFTTLALPLLVFKQTGSAVDLALITVAEYAPHLLFGLVIGAWTDRIDRRRLMIFADVMQALVISTIPLLAAFGSLPVWWIYVVGFFSSTLWVLFSTAEFAVVPALVGRDALMAANGRLQASYSAATLIGPLLAGSLMAVIPVYALLIFDALSFLVSVGSLFLIRANLAVHTPDALEGQETVTFSRNVVEGLKYVLSNPVLRGTCCMMALVNCVGFTTYAQLVLFAKRQLHASDTQVGLLYAAGSAGMILFALAASPLRSRLSFSKVALGTPMLGGILLVLMAATHGYWAALVLWAAVWGLVILSDINSNSLYQAVVPDRLLGRVRSVTSMLSWSAIPLGALVGGASIRWTHDVGLVYGVIGAAVFFIALAFSPTAVGHAGRYLTREEA